MRFQISGANATILDGTAVLTAKQVLGRSMPTGRVLWLRSIKLYNASGPIAVTLMDAAANATLAAASVRDTIRCATGSGAVYGGVLTEVEYPAPGLKFSTDCVALKDTTDASASFRPGDIVATGYYE